MILLLASSVALLAAAALLALALALRGAIERSVATLILGQAALTAILLVAGLLLRSFAPLTLLALSLATLTAVLVVLRPAGLRVSGASLRATVRSGVLGLREAFAIPPVLGVCLVAAACVAWRAVLALRLGVLDYDGFSYHLVTVDMWLQADAIARIPQRIWSDIYPANGELVTLWLMAFTRNDGLAALTGLISLPLVTVSTIGIARILGASRPWALLAGALLAITPAVIMLTTTTYVDILAAADLAAAWYLGLLAVREAEPRRRTAFLVLAGVAIGLTIGTKQTVLLPAAAMGALLVGVVLVRPIAYRLRARTPAHASPEAGSAETAARNSPRAVARDVLAVSLPALAFGSYWYLRNLLAYGNPFWPFSVGPFAGVGTFAEYLAGSQLGFGGTPAAELLLRSWTADLGTSRYEFAAPLGGYGLEWLPALALAAVALTLLAARARRGGHTARAHLAAALVIVVSATVTLAVTPMSWWARLTLFIVVAALGLAAVALTVVPRRAAVVLAMILAFAATWSVGIATATSNIPIESRYRIWSVDRLARLALRGPAERSALGYWAQCADFGRIPAGARVAVDQLDLRRVTVDGQVRIAGYGFNLLHLIVGHNLERRLAAPIGPTDDPAELRARAGAVGATHLVLASNGPTAAAASRDPAAFKPLGVACHGALSVIETEMFEVVGAG
jgi:dolichyl-phosphate-mannose-protein mannosyltransferase